jgi:hypothetical protein
VKLHLQHLVLAAGACALLGGCVVAPAPYYGYSSPDNYSAFTDDGVVYAPVAPPPLYAETVPLVAPSPVSVWIGGYWGWGGSSYVWRPGRWAVPPRAGYVWQPRRWSPGPRGGWQSSGGRWGPGPGSRPGGGAGPRPGGGGGGGGRR